MVETGPVAIQRQGFDRYGRDLVALTVAGREVDAVLLAEGLAHAYHGGACLFWCD